jgi:hypothetical protein
MLASGRLFHCTEHTYGQWLRGDSRGWRARHHREHVDGDYKNLPPAGMYDRLHAQSRRLMRRPPVEVHRRFRDIVLEAVIERLVEHRAEPLVAAFDGVHLHLVGWFPRRSPRLMMGIAKQFATRCLKATCVERRFDLGLRLGEGIWGKRGHEQRGNEFRSAYAPPAKPTAQPWALEMAR